MISCSGRLPIPTSSRSSRTIEGEEHSLCNAHRAAELQALVDIEGEAWDRHMQQLLRRANRAALNALDKDIAPFRRGLAALINLSMTTRSLPRRCLSPRESTAVIAWQQEETPETTSVPTFSKLVRLTD